MSNQRRYPRVFLTKGIQEFDKIIGIDVRWANGSITGVLDISYIGAAIIKPKNIEKKYTKGESLNFEFMFSEQTEQFPFHAEVVREDERCVAVYFPDLKVDSRRGLQKFLKEKLIGLNTKLVSPKFYIKEQGFNFWFHGPNETNIFIWGSSDFIQRATIEINRQVLTLEKDFLFASETDEFLKVPTEDYAYQVNNPDNKVVITKKDPLVHTALSILSQIEDSTGTIARLTKLLL